MLAKLLGSLPWQPAHLPLPVNKVLDESGKPPYAIELRGMVWAAVLMPMLRSIDGTHQPRRHQRRTQSYPSNRLHLVQV